MRARLGRRSREPRLDPVRWRRPGPGILLRLVVVAALLATAAAAMWYRPQSCGSAPTATCVAEPAAETRTGEPSPPPSPDGHDPAADQSRSEVPRGTVGVPIRLAEPTALRLIHPGDHVDLFRASAPQPVATAALVLGVTGTEDPITGGLLLALTPEEAARTVTTPGADYAVLIRPDG
jgi:hypothetical protein